MNTTVKTPRKKRVSQSDVPSYTLDDALRIPKAILENYGANPTVTPLKVAAAIDLSPSSSKFRMLCGASIAYGLTEGGCNAESISVMPLGNRIIRPQIEGDDVIARREATLKPRIMGEFLGEYNNSSLPSEKIAINILEEMGVARERGLEVFEMILSGAKKAGLIKVIKDKTYVDLNAEEAPVELPAEGQENDQQKKPSFAEEVLSAACDHSIDASEADDKEKHTDVRKRRVFITHGQHKQFIEPIKELLSFGELEPVVSVEKQSVSKPVPDKVLTEMRSCGAAIIHICADSVFIDKDGGEHTVLNENVLVEVGAAMALYGRRFILLVKEGISLPSNLQGLYEVRYEGDKLDGPATIKLLKAINDIKNNPLPNE